VAFPAVAQCPPPPAALLDLVANELLREEDHVRKTAPAPFSTQMCLYLHALAVLVPFHAKHSAQSPTVRACALAQLLKAQRLLLDETPPRKLHDTSDGQDRNLWLFVRVTSAIRSALQVVLASWLSAGYTSKFALEEQGGVELLQFCIRHIVSAYNQNTALNKMGGSSWERLLLTVGPTAQITSLFLKVCSNDNALPKLAKLGADKSLHALSRYGDNKESRQHATVLLSKLAVLSLNRPGHQIKRDDS